MACVGQIDDRDPHAMPAAQVKGAPRPALARELVTPALAVAALGVIAASYVFKAQVPTTVLFAPHDDGLFLRLADSLRHGDWLGPYDNLTLAKGPIYPMFLAAVDLLRLPLKLAEHAVYLGAAATMALVTLWLSRNRVLSFVLFSALALNPMMWTVELARIIRDGLYVGLSLGAFALVAWLLIVPSGAAIRQRTVLAVVSGAAIAVYWLTREEGAWLLPALGVLVIGGALRLWAARGASGDEPPRHWTRGLASLGWRLIFVVTAVTVVIGGVAAVNWNRYGVFLTNDLTGGEVPAAYGALSRIDHESTDRYVPIPASARMDAYRVSPAAEELEPFLEGQSGAEWTARSCGGPPIPGGGCNDIRAGWFVWAFREAVTLAGHWTSAAEAQDFLERLAIELNRACDDGALACSGHRESLAPSIDLATVLDASAQFGTGLATMAAARANIETGYSVGSQTAVLAVSERVGPVAPPLPDPLPPATDAAGSPMLSIMRWAGVVYAVLLLLAAAVGLVGVVLTLLRPDRRVRFAPLLIVALACAAAVVTRLGLIAIIEVTSWPGSINNVYLAPGSPFLITFAVIGGYLALASGSDLVPWGRRDPTGAERPMDPA